MLDVSNIKPGDFKSFGITGEQDQKNLQKLSCRKRGELLYLKKDGSLETMDIFKRMGYCFIPSYKETVQRQLNAEIDRLTASIELKPQTNSRSRKFLKTLFFETLAPLSRTIYKRKFQSSVIHFFDRQVRVITPRGDPLNDASKSYKSAYSTAKLWARLGNFDIPGGGTGGAYRIIQSAPTDIRGREDKSLGIFKPSDEDAISFSGVHLKPKIQYIMARIFRPFTALTFDCVNGQGYIAEVATKKVEKYVISAISEYQKQHPQTGLSVTELVSDTQVAMLTLGKRSEQIGSFQLWIDGTRQTATEFFKTSREYTGAVELTKDKLQGELFDLLAIMDFATANHDRHGDNWFVMVDKNNNSQGIRLIDGGWSMAPRHPTAMDLPELRRQYLWKHLPDSNKPFTDLGKHVIKDLWKNRLEMKREIQALYDRELPDEKEKNKARVEKMVERIELMYEARETITKNKLAGIRKDSDFKGVYTLFRKT